MSIRKRLSQDESRSAALTAARALLIESGPQSVTLKAVAARVGRTHANLLHHFGSAEGLQKALARHLASTICASIAKAVLDSRTGTGSPREVVDMTFDAFDREGGGALACWMMLSGNKDALDPIVEAIHDLVDEMHASGPGNMREITQSLVLMALGDSLMGKPLANALGIDPGSARDTAVQMLKDFSIREGLPQPVHPEPSQAGEKSVEMSSIRK
jgi:AcrR family transcriptional regulator